MGDRANVRIKEGSSDVYLYTHWTGTELPETLRDALRRGRSRWSDGPYLARIVFGEMTQGEPMGTTGYGISSVVCDGGRRVLTVDVDAQTVEWPGHNGPMAFTDFAALESVGWGEDGD